MRRAHLLASRSVYGKACNQHVWAMGVNRRTLPTATGTVVVCCGALCNPFPGNATRSDGSNQTRSEVGTLDMRIPGQTGGCDEQTHLHRRLMKAVLLAAFVARHHQREVQIDEHQRPIDVHQRFGCLRGAEALQRSKITRGCCLLSSNSQDQHCREEERWE